MEIQGQVRLFAELDKAQSGKSGEKGVYARDLDSFKGIKKAIAYIFGSTVNVGGKTYVVSSQSFNAFKARNPDLGVKSFNWSQVSALLKKDPTVQMPTKKTATITAKELQTHDRPAHLTKKECAHLMGPKGLGLSEKVANEVSEKLDINKPIKEQLPALLKDHIAHLPHQEQKEMKDLIAWIKSPSQKTEDAVINDLEEVSAKAGVPGRLTDVAGKTKMEDVKDPAHALKLLGKIVADSDKGIDPSKTDMRSITLENYRAEIRQPGVGNNDQEQAFFDHVIKTAGFKIEDSGKVTWPHAHASPKK